MLAEGYNITPTNATNAIDRKGVSNRDSDILMYILIVVGASILLLLIPLISYIVQLSKRRLRRRRRRKQIEKAYARRMAERDILEKIISENRKTSADGSALIINNGPLEILPERPINDSPTSSGSVESQPCSPTRIHRPVIEEMKPMAQCDLNGYATECGQVNKGYRSNSTPISLPLRKATSDMYLPRDPTLMNTAKRRFSENMMETREYPSVNDVYRKASLMSEKSIEKRRFSELKEKEIQKIDEEVEKNEEKNVRKKSNEDLNEDNDRKVSNSVHTSINSESPEFRKFSLDSGCQETVQTDNNSAFESDDYDDIYDDIYENVNRNGPVAEEDGPIYDVVESPYSSDSEHIYSNIDELSDTESHIYRNIDDLHGDTMKSNEVESDVESEGEDDYENLDFLHRNGDGEESDTSSVSYENLDFLDGNENKAEEDKNMKEKDTPPLIIPRRIPIPNENSKRRDFISTDENNTATNR